MALHRHLGAHADASRRVASRALFRASVLSIGTAQPMVTRIPYLLVLWTVASVLAEHPAWEHPALTGAAPPPRRSISRIQRLKRGGKGAGRGGGRGGGRGVTNRRKRRVGATVTGLPRRFGRPAAVTIPRSQSCGIDRAYRKPGPTPQEYKSQGGEDAFLNRHFNGTRYGTYLDIGCNDGIDGSNTYYFHQRGWQGVCVEADPAKFLQIQPHSSRRDGVNLAIANSSSCLSFARVHDKNNGLSGLASTLDHERARVFGITR